MKKEYKLVGKVTIPKKKRKEVKSIIQKILYLGGIREKETIEIDGRQCITAGIPKWNARASSCSPGRICRRSTLPASRRSRCSWLSARFLLTCFICRALRTSARCARASSELWSRFRRPSPAPLCWGRCFCRPTLSALS